MLGILLCVVAEIFRGLAVCLCVACSLGSSRNGVDIGFASFYPAVCLRRGTEDAEATEIEIEEVGRRIDGA